MVGIEDSNLVSLSKGLNFILWLVAEILTNLHSYYRFVENPFQHRLIEALQLPLSFFSLSQLALEKQNPTRQDQKDIWLTVTSPLRICIANPKIVIEFCIRSQGSL